MLLFINLFSFLFYTKICVQTMPILGQNFSKKRSWGGRQFGRGEQISGKLHLYPMPDVRNLSILIQGSDSFDTFQHEFGISAPH